MPGYNKSRRYIGPRVSYGWGGAALKFGSNLVDNLQSGKKLGSGLLKGTMKGVGKAAVTPGSGFAAAGDLVGGLTQNAKNPFIKNLGQAVDTATNFLPGGGGVRQTVKDVAGYIGNNQQAQGNAPLTGSGQGQQGGFMNKVNNFMDSPVGQNIMGQGQQGGLLNTAMNFLGEAGQAVPHNNPTMQGVTLMKNGGVYAENGVNTNGVNGDPSTMGPGDTTPAEPGAFSMGIQMASDSLEAAKRELLNGLSPRLMEKARELGIIDNQDNMSFYDVWSSLNLTDGEAKAAINRTAGRNTQESARLLGAWRNIDKAHEIFDDAGLSFDEGLSRLDQQLTNQGFTAGQPAENFATYLSTSEINLGQPMWGFLADPTKSDLQGNYAGRGGNFVMPSYDEFEEANKSTFLGFEAGQKGITRGGDVGSKAIDSGIFDVVFKGQKLPGDFEPSQRRETTRSKRDRGIGDGPEFPDRETTKDLPMQGGNDGGGSRVGGATQIPNMPPPVEEEEIMREVTLDPIEIYDREEEYPNMQPTIVVEPQKPKKNPELRWDPRWGSPFPDTGLQGDYFPGGTPNYGGTGYNQFYSRNPQFHPEHIKFLEERANLMQKQVGGQRQFNGGIARKPRVKVMKRGGYNNY
jgi:hypothetical protein